MFARPACEGSAASETRRVGVSVQYPSEVREAAAGRRVVAGLIDAFGRIDVVGTNAGIIHRRPVVEVTEAEWARVIAVNLKGTFNAIPATLAHLIRQRSGKIVTVTSE